MISQPFLYVRTHIIHQIKVEYQGYLMILVVKVFVIDILWWNKLVIFYYKSQYEVSELVLDVLCRNNS